MRYQSFLYQAAGSTKAQRVVAKVEYRFGELFPRMGFIVTNLGPDNRTRAEQTGFNGAAEG